MQLPEKSFDGSPYYNFFYLYTTWKGSNGSITPPPNPVSQFGSATITQYRYEICSYVQANRLRKITDIVSNLTISPRDYAYVADYKTRMHANVTHMEVIGQSYLNSNSSRSYTLSGGFSIEGATLKSGSFGASTSNNYSTNNQTIQNNFYYQKLKNWNASPTENWAGASWELEPCIRIMNLNASVYKSQAYSSFQEGGLIVFFDEFHEIPFVEVGGAWNP
ncbi:MAG: hypothetical protein PHV03_09780 [Desulfitobacteriaceae bacterium]|nr:hypothetical protein [Desulfitobacteriaceae bacterium]